MRYLLIPLGLLALNACNAQPSGGAQVPAVISEPTAQSRAELRRLVSGALGGTEVTLADDALTRSSTLIIERNPPRGLQQQPALGRNMEKPWKFLLLLSDGRCYLERESDGKRWELVEASCAPAGG